MSFTSGVTSTDDQDIDILFGDKTPGADNILGAEKKPDEKVEDDKKDKTKKAAVANTKSAVEGEPAIEVIDHDSDADTLLGGPDETETEVEDTKTDTTKKVAAPAKKVTKLDSAQEVNYEAIYQDMVEKGLWKELDDLPADFKWTKDGFLEVQKLQTTSQYEDLLDKTGPYGKAIIEYEKNGGNPGELLNLFREQREIQEFDITDTDSQETFLRAYLEAQGNSEKSIERMVKALQDQGPEALKEEAEEKKAIWDAQYKKEIEDRKKEQALYSKQVEDAARTFSTTIETALSSDTDVTPKERKDLQAYMLNYTQNFNGRQVSQFYVDMAEIQKDPKNYIELAKFIKGIKTGDYVRKVADKVKKDVSATSYLKIKNSSTVKPSGSETPGLQNLKGSSFIDYLAGKK